MLLAESALESVFSFGPDQLLLTARHNCPL